VAQSLCALPGSHFARYWMHNGMLLVDGEKMSKSVGNFRTVQDILGLGPWAGESFRLLLLKTHYRAALDYTEAALAEARKELDRFYRALSKMADVAPERGTEPHAVEQPAVEQALADDLNTPLALASLHYLVSAVNEALVAGDDAALPHLKGRILEAGALLGILQQNPEHWFRPPIVGHLAGVTPLPSMAATGTVGWPLTEEGIQAAIAARLAARKAKDWPEADRIRKDLAEKGILLEDGPGGTTWRRA
jgi:cysteinyl-tRNA synthetase